MFCGLDPPAFFRNHLHGKGEWGKEHMSILASQEHRLEFTTKRAVTASMGDILLLFIANSISNRQIVYLSVVYHFDLFYFVSWLGLSSF